MLCNACGTARNPRRPLPRPPNRCDRDGPQPPPRCLVAAALGYPRPPPGDAPPAPPSAPTPRPPLCSATAAPAAWARRSRRLRARARRSARRRARPTLTRRPRRCRPRPRPPSRRSSCRRRCLSLREAALVLFPMNIPHSVHGAGRGRGAAVGRGQRRGWPGGPRQRAADHSLGRGGHGGEGRMPEATGGCAAVAARAWELTGQGLMHNGEGHMGRLCGEARRRGSREGFTRGASLPAAVAWR